MSLWHTKENQTALAELKSDAKQGLSTTEATQRLNEYGHNELIDKGGKTIWSILWEQLTDVMVVILIIAAVVSALVGEVEDTFVIAIIVLLNASLGVSQEYRAEQAMAALKKLAVPVVRAKRDGRVSEISARELVPGDVVLLEAGNLIPADGRLLESINLKIEEAALTGESEPVNKRIEALPDPELPLGDRRNMAFMGTLVTYGRGELLITGTGMKTELGKIADLLQNVAHEQTPLQRRLDGLGHTLGWLALGIIGIVFILGLTTNAEITALWGREDLTFWQKLTNEHITELFLTAISMAVAAVPEGLPAVVTIALALGAQRMLKRNALIRKLPAVETLGSVTVICSDKTGTLTQNKMTVTLLDIAGSRETLDTLVQDEVPLAQAEHQPDAAGAHKSLSLLLKAGAYCNDGEINTDVDGNQKAIGDPTETALIVAANKFGLNKTELEQQNPRVAEAPFTSARKRMTTVHKVGNSSSGSPWASSPYVAFTKGSVDGLVEIATAVWTGNSATPMTPDLKKRILTSNEELASKGFRVLGTAFRLVKELPEDALTLENELTFIGFVGIIDPPREEVRLAVEECLTAGIRPIMITGDHPLTAQHIAKELLIASNDKVATGVKLNQSSPAELTNFVQDTSVFARVSPEHKLQIVEALQNQGQIVAMTGDGVNDAPALKKADIGVAMGITGTDVSKEAADMVLLDDNFATIVAAVREGRTIYDNIRKFIKYILSTNFGEVLVMLFAPLMGLPLPLLPIQILWVNLVTDGIPGLALSIEPEEKNVMKRPPYHPQESIFSRGAGYEIAIVGSLLGALALLVGYVGYLQDQALGSTAEWTTMRTMAFTALTFGQMGHALAVRSHQESLWSIGLFSNKVMIWAVVVTVVLQLLLVYVPFIQPIFHTTSLSAVNLFYCFLTGILVFAVVEGMKWYRRTFEK